MLKRTNIQILIICLILIYFYCSKQQNQLPKVIPNPSFEQVENDKPESWRTYIWEGKADFEHADIAKIGKRSVAIISKEGADVSWGTVISIKPFSTYKLSGWIKTENLQPTTGKGALFNLHGFRGVETSAITGTQDWTQVEMEFNTKRNDAIQINCLLGGWGLATGKAWFDDMNLELISSKELNPSVTIHAEKTKETISNYIYGQFIEHLGRCIYGGIWAEMLEDRKFYYPITDEYAPWGKKSDEYWKAGEFKHLVASPWKVVGPNGTVKMDVKDPFVGEHTPVIQLPGNGTEAGISQDGLAIIKDKKYQGRIVLSGEPNVTLVEIRLVLDDNHIIKYKIENINITFQTFPFEFVATTSSENARLEIVSKSEGYFKIGTISLMPANNVKGWRPDVVALLNELNSPIYRWPGGNFVSGYNWRDGIGDMDKRPPRKNPAWTGVEHNDVGIHEYMDLMELINAEPFIAVNTGLGTVKEVAKQVEYCNSSIERPMGKLRAQNGHPEPFGVQWWAVGNEMYGSWQLGHMPLEDYVKKHNRVAKTMWNVDPTINLVAVGSVGKWSETMMSECSDFMDLISEHIYTQEKPGLLGHTGQLAQQIKWKADVHRKYREEIPGLAEKDIRIAMDEWNFWYGDYIYGELGVRYFLKDALGVAIGLHEYFRNSDLYYMANYAQTVNVIGCIKTTKTDAAFATTGLVLKLYRQHFGTIPLEITGATEPLDVVASLTEDKKYLTIGVVNPTEEKVKLPIQLQSSLVKDGKHWLITGKDAMDYNEPGKEPNVKIEEKNFYFSDIFTISPISANLYKFEVK